MASPNGRKGEREKGREKNDDSAVSHSPTPPFSHSILYVTSEESARQNIDAAVDYYRKALAQDENAVFAANNLAWLYAVYGKGNMDEAVRLAQSAVQTNPQVPSFADTLGWVYYKKGLYSAAAEQLRKAVTVDEAAARANNGVPTPTYHFHLGVALAAKGDKAGARREIESALRLSGKTSFPEADEARKALATL